MLKELDSKLWSAMGAAGELYAIRSNLFEPIKNDPCSTILYSLWR
jgi:hypothetical protein